MTGYYIHNQKKDGSGVSQKISAQMEVFKEHFNMHEIILEKKKETKIQRKLRQKLFKKRPKLLYDDAYLKIREPDFVYIRKQILDADFLNFLKKIKESYPLCKIIMEVPTYPYWNEYPKNKLGEEIIAQEKQVIPQLKKYVDTIVDVGNEKELFEISTININNGVDPKQVKVSGKREKTDTINLIAVARLREAHGYERIIESIKEYYKDNGNRNIILHVVGEGSELGYYKSLAENDFCKNRVIFYGYKTGDELEKIYDLADLGLGFFGQYKTGGHYVSAIKCAEYLMRGIPVVSAVDEEYLLELLGKYYLSFPDDASAVDMNIIIDFYDKVYAGNIEDIHESVRQIAKEKVAIDVVMKPVIKVILEDYEENN